MVRRVAAEFIASVDQGTASSRCLIFDSEARVVSVGQKEHHHIFPRPGWVEHDPEEIWHNVVSVVQDALSRAQLSPGDLTALGITNQRETTVVWDRESGRPVHNAINWQDMRTDRIASSSAADSRWPRTSRARSWPGCSSTWTACAGAPRPATSCSGRWTRG
jgi:glycerol kinase